VEDSEGAGLSRGGKGRDAFRTISEVAEQLDLPQHVLRFWESKFSQIKPLKRGGNRRYYRPDDVTLLTAIKKLLHNDGYTIRGVQKLFKAQGVKATIDLALDEEAPSILHAIEEREASVSTEDTGEDNNASVNPVSQPDIKRVIDRLKALRATLG